MKKNLRWKLILVAIVVGLAIIFAYPPDKKIHLGLDLEGGMHLVLEVITDDAIINETNYTILRVEERLKKEKIEYGKIVPGKIGHFSIQEINPEQEGELETF